MTGCDVVVASGAIARCASLSGLHIFSAHVGWIRCASIASGIHIPRCASLSYLHILSAHVGRIRCASIASGKKTGKVSPPCPFFLKPKRLLRVVITQRITSQHNPRSNHTAQQHSQNQGNCLFRAIATNRQCRFHHIAVSMNIKIINF